MTKFGWFLTFLITLIYGLTAANLLQSNEAIISKHPLFIYSVVVLILLVISFRMEGKAKTILLCFSFFFLLMYYISLIYSSSMAVL